MEHSLSVIVARGPGNRQMAERLGIAFVPAGEFVIIPLDPDRTAALVEALEITDRSLSEMPADSVVSQQLAKALGFARFALVETPCEAGEGPERATVYHGVLRTMPLQTGPASVNDALERVGVRPEAGRDALATIGLAGMRHADLFDRA